MIRYRLLALLTCTLLCMDISAQSAQKSRTYYVMYEKETWLARNGQDVWLVNTDMEWPRVLDDYTMPALQTYLAKHLFSVDASTPTEALTLLRHKTGEQITQMPNDANIERHYLNCQLNMTYYEQDRYISFFLKVSETDSNGKATRAERQWLTYDIVNDRVLTADDVFHSANMAGLYDDASRIAFETLIAQNAQCNESEMANIDLRTLPLDFSVEGAIMRFDLGGTSDNYSFVTMENLEQLSLLNRKFLKWYKKEGKQKTTPMTTESAPIAQQDYFTGEDSVYLLTEQMPEYPEGKDSLYSYLTHNIQVPAIYAESSISGRTIVSFVVEKDGTLSNMAVIRSLDRPIDKAAIDVLRKSKPWKPGMIGGNPVRTRMTLPVAFRLQ